MELHSHDMPHQDEQCFYIYAVTRLSNGNTYGYDANGNMTQRTIGGVSYTLEYDAENRLTTVKQGATTIAAFVYDGDDVRVKGTLNGVTTAYVGEILEWTGSTSSMVEYHPRPRSYENIGLL